MRTLGLFIIVLLFVFVAHPRAHADVEVQVESINTVSIERNSEGNTSFEVQVTARNLSLEDAEARITVQALDKNGKKLKTVKLRGSVWGMSAQTLAKKVSMPTDDFDSIVKWEVVRFRAW